MLKAESFGGQSLRQSSKTASYQERLSRNELNTMTTGMANPKDFDEEKLKDAINFKNLM